MTPSGELPRGHVINNLFRIDDILGEGGMGIVYRATEITTNIPVVVKAIRPEFANKPAYRRRLIIEAKVQASINHQNVVPMRTVVIEGNNIFLVLQFIQGESLDKTLARYRQNDVLMPIDEALAVFRQILQGVGAAHDAQVIHRDIKPGNILISEKDKKVLVTDFGIAKNQQNNQATTNWKTGIIGSPHYFSPEQIDAVSDIDLRADIYSLGIVLFEMLAGRVPFNADSHFAMMNLHRNIAIPSIRSIRPEVPAHIEYTIQKACAKARENRFASTTEMALALETPITEIPSTEPYDHTDGNGVQSVKSTTNPPIDTGKPNNSRTPPLENTTTGPLVRPLFLSDNANPSNEHAATPVTPSHNIKTRGIIVLASAASLVLGAAAMGIATLTQSPATTCRSDETQCGNECCNNATSECVDNKCVCKTGNQCGEGRVCNAEHACVDGCFIDGQYLSFGGNPNNVCQVCEKSNPFAWVPAPKGTRCQSGGSSCNGRGTCVYPPSIAAGHEFTCGVTETGSVKCWGKNDFGQLGTKPGNSLSPGSPARQISPQKVSGLAEIASIAVGGSHACALSKSGGILCWGKNDKKQLGQFNMHELESHKLSKQGYKAVTAGDSHTCAINSADGVECWGWNRDGQVGNGIASETADLAQVKDLDSGVTDISAGVSHTCALKSGAVLCWGDNQFGRLGVGDEKTRLVPTQVIGLDIGIIAISAQNGFTCAVRQLGEPLCWGHNLYGQLGANSKRNSSSPSLVLDGGVEGKGLREISVVSNGDRHACARASRGSVLCWGSNEDGQLGYDTKGKPALFPAPVMVQSGVSFTQISAGSSHTCAITSAGDARCWGANKHGELGINSTEEKRTMPTPTKDFP